MPVKPVKPRSIASQLVVCFALAAALLLCCGIGVLYWIVIRHAFEEDDQDLTDKIFALRSQIRDGEPDALRAELETLRAGGRDAYWVRVLDSNGQTVAGTPGINTILPGNVFPVAQTSDRAEPGPKYHQTDGKLFALIAVAEERGGRRYTIQVAQDRSADEQFTKRFGVLVVAVLCVGSLAAALIAITVTRRGLRPLAEMTRSFERTGPGRLHERVAPAAWPRELKPLALAFHQMLERLEDSFTRLSQFSADLAHELRTPLANLRGEAEVALTRFRTPEEYRDVIESSVAECEKLSGLIDSLLFLARAEAAETQIKRTVFDGRAALEKIAAYYETIAEERHIAIVCAGQGEVYADPVLFGRAISNLVDNALRFSPEHGTVQITLAVPPGRSEVSVRDAGGGIAPQHMTRIFDRFYRADLSRSSHGAGLGLAIVKSIADLHGGSASAKSQPEGGTTLTLSFPSKA